MVWVSSDRPPSLDWLGPTLDECRRIIDGGVRDIRQKPSDQGRQLVTDLDVAVERELILAIRDHIPAAGIFSEETEHDPRVLDESEVCFVIDPIDGTDQLIAGSPDFAISVAQYASGRPVAAVLDLPRLDERFEGAQGRGIWRNRERVELRLQAAGLAGVRIAVSVSQRRDPRLEPVWERFEAADLVPTPAFTPKFATILRGDCAAAMHLPVDDRHTYLWDFAAVAFLLVELGGVFLTWAGQDLTEARPLVHAGGWIAAVDLELANGLRRKLGDVVGQV